jgi:hypothetical protein
VFVEECSLEVTEKVRFNNEGTSHPSYRYFVSRVLEQSVSDCFSGGRADVRYDRRCDRFTAQEQKVARQNMNPRGF